ncbi:MAG: hypothetical protein NTZ51_09740, partial [Proteobacteria bacterium]|nr:hypothetical protein [Pseudomonadota bacterium]
MGCRNVYLYRLMTGSFLLLAFTLTLSCSQQKEPQQSAPSAPCPAILIAQAQFKSVTGPDGKTQQQPGPALL